MSTFKSTLVETFHERRDHDRRRTPAKLRASYGLSIHNDQGARLVKMSSRRALPQHAQLGVLYTADDWTGTPINAEPHKCGGIGWFPLHQVPPNTVPYHAAAIASVAAGRIHSVFGWDT